MLHGIRTGSSVSIGIESGRFSQRENCVAIGAFAGKNDQAIGSVAIGAFAGKTSQGVNSIAIGIKAADGLDALGISTGEFSGENSISIGSNATSTGINSIAIGTGARSFANGIAIGRASANNNSIAIVGGNSVAISFVPNSFVVAPIRNLSGGNTLKYNSTTCEISYDTSSAIFKKNIVSLIKDTNVIHKVRPVEFDLKVDNSHHVGFIAEELNELDTCLTTKNSKGEPEGIEWNSLHTFVIAELIKLRKDFDSFVKENEMLKEKVKVLEENVNVKNVL
jgi:hypothetical protein